MLLGSACSQEPSQPQVNAAENTIAPQPVETNDASPTETVLDRATFLITLMEAASAAAVGRDDSPAQRALNGRRFDLRMRFGCAPGDASSARRWSHDEAAGSLKVLVKPDLQIDDGKGGSSSGFLVSQPMLLEAGCAPEEFASAFGSDKLQFGIVQPIREDEPRSRRLLDAYEIVRKISPAAVPNQGLDLVVRGRLDSGDTGRTILCEGQGGAMRCLARASIDQVSIEDPASGLLIAEWGGR